MGISMVRTDSSDVHFVSLVKELDRYLAVVDGNEHDFYDQYNKIDAIRHVVVAFKEGKAVSCGAIKEYGTETMEVKRMYTEVDHRGRGIASQVLQELERWACELGYKYCILETGKKQTAAISLYKRSGYDVIPNFGQYAGIENSICFRKALS